MAQEKLIVKNFGPIKEAEIELGKVTVFIGEQASGKSVLAKLVTIFQSIEFLSKILIEEDKKKDIKENLLTYGVDQYLQENTFIKYESNIYTAIYKNELLEIQESELIKKNYEAINDTNFIEKASKELRTILGKVMLSLAIIEVLSRIVKKRNGIAHGLQNDQITVEEDLVRRLYYVTEAMHAIYFPAERQLISILSDSLFNLLNSDIKLPKFILNFGDLFKEAQLGTNGEDISFFNIKYFIENGIDYVFYKDAITKLSQSSSGLQSLVPLLIVIKHNNRTKELKKNYVVEEPELNLYPTYQKILVNFLASECTKDGDHLILTTHSPYILSSLDNLIQAGNVVKKHPELKEEVEKIIPSQYHLNYEDVKVYFVADGKARLIMNEEYQGIDVNELDMVSENLNEEFEKLLDLKYQD